MPSECKKFQLSLFDTGLLFLEFITAQENLETPGVGQRSQLGSGSQGLLICLHHSTKTVCLLNLANTSFRNKQVLIRSGLDSKELEELSIVHQTLTYESMLSLYVCLPYSMALFVYPD